MRKSLCLKLCLQFLGICRLAGYNTLLSWDSVFYSMVQLLFSHRVPILQFLYFNHYRFILLVWVSGCFTLSTFFINAIGSRLMFLSLRLCYVLFHAPVEGRETRQDTATPSYLRLSNSRISFHALAVSCFVPHTSIRPWNKTGHSHSLTSRSVKLSHFFSCSGCVMFCSTHL